MIHSQRPSPKALEYLKEGQSLYYADSPDYATAEHLFRKALEVAPRWGEAYHFLAFALERQSKLEEACAAEREAIRLLPGDPRSLISIGRLLHSLGRPAEAIPYFEEGLRLKPHYAEADARFMLSEALESLGQIDKAVQIWRQIIKMDSTYPSYDRLSDEASKKLSKHGL
jgi:tetratricopeptide (TPR) repeat protein